MRFMHENQKRAMDYLLDHPAGATLDELSAFLGITRTAVKEHLIRLQGLGYVTHVDAKGSVGRPKRSYLLSVEGQEAFPRQYSWLSNVLLEHLAEDLGAKGIAQVMNQLAGKVAMSMQARFVKKGSSVELIAELANALNDLGYRAAVRQSDLRKGAVIEATNCVYHHVAKKHPALCQFDVKFMEKATGLSVKLESCIAKGAAVCRFCMRSPKA